MDGVINIKTVANKCFLWYHIRNLNPLKRHAEITTKANKNMINNLEYEGIKVLVSKTNYSKIEQKNNICINVFCYENDLTYPVYVVAQKYKGCMDLPSIRRF